MKNNDRISKYLSYILRHKPDSIDLKLDNQWWADIDTIIEKTSEFKLDKGTIEEIVKTSLKQRFSIEGNKIRANQGHSIKVDLGLQPKKPPMKLFHGTATRFLDRIMMEGLLPQERQYVHLSKNIEIAIEVGKRYGKPVVLDIDSSSMYKDGHNFYLSDNNVWLTNHIAPKYISIYQG